MGGIFWKTAKKRLHRALFPPIWGGLEIVRCIAPLSAPDTSQFSTPKKRFIFDRKSTPPPPPPPTPPRVRQCCWRPMGGGWVCFGRPPSPPKTHSYWRTKKNISVFSIVFSEIFFFVTPVTMGLWGGMVVYRNTLHVFWAPWTFGGNTVHRVQLKLGF